MKNLMCGILAASFILSSGSAFAQNSKPAYVSLQAGIGVPSKDFSTYAATVPGYQFKLNAYKTVVDGLGIMVEAGTSQFAVNTDKRSHDLNNDYDANFVTQSDKWESRYLMAGLGYTFKMKYFSLQPYAMAGYAGIVSPAENGFYQQAGKTYGYSIQRSVGRNLSYGGGLKLIGNLNKAWTFSIAADYYDVRSNTKPSYFTYQVNNPWEYTIGKLETPLIVQSIGFSVGIVRVLNLKD